MLCSLSINIHNTKQDEIVNDTALYIIYLQQQILLRDSIISTWENHCLRMKRIVGADDQTESWSYKEKVINKFNK